MDDVAEERPELTEEELRAEHGGWLDGNPFYLMIVADEGEHAKIDLGERGWIAKNAPLMRAPGRWFLVQKHGDNVVAMILVNDGEQPYYVARHVGFASVSGAGPNAETIAYGIGKKRLDGHVDRIWLLANGVVVTGDDVEPIALDMLKHGQL